VIAMNGIVMKITDQKLVVLCEDGKYRNIPLPSVLPNLGDKIAIADHLLTVQHDTPQKGKQITLLKRGLLAAAFLGFFIFASWVLTDLGKYSDPVAMIAIDINPSVEIFIDAEENVTKVSLINEEAKRILNENEWIGMNFYDAVNMMISKAEQSGFLDSSSGQRMVMVSVVDLKSRSFEVDLEKVPSGLTFQVSLFYSDREHKTKADELNLTLNKYLVYEQAKKMEIDLDVEELRQTSIVDSLSKAGLDFKSFFNLGQQKTPPPTPKNPSEIPGEEKRKDEDLDVEEDEEEEVEEDDSDEEYDDVDHATDSDEDAEEDDFEGEPENEDSGDHEKDKHDNEDDSDEENEHKGDDDGDDTKDELEDEGSDEDEHGEDVSEDSDDDKGDEKDD
jgi:hypothetical protein